MTEQEKKEFEEFLKWKKENENKANSVVDDTETSTSQKSAPIEAGKTNEGTTYDRNEKTKVFSAETNRGDSLSSEDKIRKKRDSVIWWIIIFIVIVISIVTCVSNKNRSLSDDKEDTLDTDTVAVVDETILPSEPQKVTWKISSEKDEMTDTQNTWAKIVSDNFISQDFPYEGYTYASITVRYMKKYGYDVLVSITKGQIDGREYYGTDYVTARFDEGAPKKYYYNESADGSSDVIFIRNASDFIKRCKQAKDIKIDIPIYKAGRPVFVFHVDEPLVWPNE